MKSRSPSYSEKLKAIQPYVELKVKNPDRSSKKTRAEISRYFNAVKQLKGQNRAFVKVNSEKNRSRAISQLTPDKSKLKRFKGVFVPGNYGDKPKLEFPKDEKSIRIRTAYSEEDVAFFDAEKFAKDPESEIRKANERLKEYSTIVPLSVNGYDEESALNVYGAGDLESLIEEIFLLITKYPQAGEHKLKNGRVKEGWLVGLKGIDFKGQEEPDEEDDFNEEESEDEGEEEIQRPKRIRKARGKSRNRRGASTPARKRKAAPKKGNPRRATRPRPNHGSRRGTKRTPIRPVRKSAVKRPRSRSGSKRK